MTKQKLVTFAKVVNFASASLNSKDLLKTTTKNAWELLNERQTRKYPTAPLHSEGTDISGVSEPNIYVGWGIDPNYVLVQEYINQLNSEKSDLSKWVKDITKFMEDVANICDEWNIDVDDFIDDDRRISERDKKIITYAYLLHKYGEAKMFTSTCYGDDDGSSDEIETIIVGIRIQHTVTYDEFMKSVKAAKKKLLEIVKDLPEEKIGIFVLGNYVSGHVG